MFAAPHGLFADEFGNVWVTDFPIRNGKGYTVKKFSPDEKLLMTLESKAHYTRACATIIWLFMRAA
jgi:hypothetical protein